MTETCLVALLEGRPLLRRKDLERRFGVCSTTISRWMNDGSLPKPVYCHCPMWRPQDIEQFETSRMADRIERDRIHKLKFNAYQREWRAKRAKLKNAPAA